MPRIRILRNLTLIILGIIAVRLFCIQIIEHDKWVDEARAQHTLLETITARRGEIYFMDGDEPVPVVLNQTTYQVIIDPSITDRTELEQALTTYAADFITANLDEVYSIEGLKYYIVARGVPYAAAKNLAEAGVAGIWLKEGNQRVYPEGEMAAQLLGFVNSDGLGQYGVEGSFNDLLSGKDGLLKTISDVNNIALSIGDDNVKIPAEDGKNLVLSIDRGLERGVEDLAAAAIEDTVATNAAVLVMNPNTGEVLAMASLPEYNPASYNTVSDAAIFMNQVTEVPYEPASICKSFTYSAAINEGVMTPESTYFNQGYEIIDGWQINNAEQRDILYGTLDMRTALWWSLNTGSIHALKLLGGNANSITQAGREKLYDYYHNRFRLDYPTGIEISEVEGIIPDPVEGYGRDSTYANLTFGQNLAITMIQTATAWSAVVNGGVYHTPTVVKGVLDGDKIIPLSSVAGNEATAFQDTASDNSDDGATDADLATEGTSTGTQILKPETSATMRELLINNRDYKVRSGIDRPGYAIGGKTGTAQVVKNGAYDDTMSELVGSYIGFLGPTGELPQYVIMVKMWGAGQQVGSGDANNLFDSIANFAIDYLKIKPGPAE